MTDALRWGFKKQAEALALEVRSDLGLGPHARFDPNVLAARLAIPVISLPDLARAGARRASIEQFLTASPEDLSAMTVFFGTFRLIVENPVHPPGRRANSLAHELSHVVLEHEPAGPIGAAGCRVWDPRMEAEADWLAGALLVPRPVALRIARLMIEVPFAARSYGVSTALMEWRLNHTGARKQAWRESHRTSSRATTS